MAPLLEVSSLRMRFPGMLVLEGISFSVAPGSLTALIGAGGAGKTTLLHCIAGVHAPSEGEIRFAGSNIAGWRAHRIARAGVALTFQTPAIFEGLTVRQNLLAGAYVRGRSGFLGSALMSPRVWRERRDAEIITRDVLALLGMSQSAEASPRDLSYAWRKRLDFGRTLMRSPRLVLLDEPLAGLNATERGAMTNLIERARGELGVTFLIAERALPFAMASTDKIVVLDRGRVLAEGPPGQVQASA